MLNIDVQNVDLRVLIKMAKVIITIKIMPEGPDVNLEDLKGQLEGKIKDYKGVAEIIIKTPKEVTVIDKKPEKSER